VAEGDLETGPRLWNAGVKIQGTALDAKSKDALDAGALHPAGRAGIPSPATAPDVAGSGVDVGGDDIGLHLAVHVDSSAGVVARLLQRILN